MGIVDDVHLLARLWIKCPDLAVSPSGDDGLAISHERHCEALTVGVVDSQQLGTILSIPDPNIVLRGGGEHIRVAPR